MKNPSRVTETGDRFDHKQNALYLGSGKGNPPTKHLSCLLTISSCKEKFVKAEARKMFMPFGHYLDASKYSCISSSCYVKFLVALQVIDVDHLVLTNLMAFSFPSFTKSIISPIYDVNKNDKL